MELVLTDEQKLLRDSAARLIERRAGPAQHRALRDTGSGFDRGVLVEIGEAGWLALLVGEDAGGLGLGATELAVVLEQAGRALLTAPVDLLYNGEPVDAARAQAAGQVIDFAELCALRDRANQTAVKAAGG